MDKKQNCCPHCGAGAESIYMELPTVVKFSMMVGENGNAMLKARVDDDDAIVECSEDNARGNFCECMSCGGEFYGALNDDGTGYVFSKERFK